MRRPCRHCLQYPTEMFHTRERLINDQREKAALYAVKYADFNIFRHEVYRLELMKDEARHAGYNLHPYEEMDNLEYLEFKYEQKERHGS